MGCYINPKDQSKESWLAKNAIIVVRDVVETFDYNDSQGLVPVVLINNGAFTAAGVAYDADERDVFLAPDLRERMYFLVEIDKVRTVSPYHIYTGEQRGKE